MRLFGCRKFHRLAWESSDRDLNAREKRFMQRHREACDSCEDEESVGAFRLNMLAGAVIDPAPTPGFEDRVLRLYKVQSKRESFAYWSPAVVGACIAMLAILAAMQMVTRSSELPHFQGGGSEAHRVDRDFPKFPNIVIRNGLNQ